MDIEKVLENEILKITNNSKAVEYLFYIVK